MKAKRVLNMAAATSISTVTMVVTVMSQLAYWHGYADLQSKHVHVQNERGSKCRPARAEVPLFSIAVVS
jgi:hypothetical protein